MNDAAFAEAMAHHQAGHSADAAALYQAILSRDPDHADSLHLLGLITAEQADPHAGIAMIRRAMALDPGSAAHHNSLGHAYRRLGQIEQAAREYGAGVALRPNSGEVLSNLAGALRDLGRHAEAIEYYRRAAEHAPGIADVWYNLANALADTDPSAEIDVCYRKAIELQPNYVDALGNYGRWLMTQGRWTDAEIALTKAVQLAPLQALAWNHLGVVLQELGRRHAAAAYRNAIALDPAMAGAHYNLGRLLFEQGRTDDAIACNQAAIAIHPEFGTARIAACMAQLPILYQTEDEVVQRRKRYWTALAELAVADPLSLAGAIGVAQPFFLPYQGGDDRALQATYGQLACRILAQTEQPARLAAPPAPGQRIRLGIVSGFFCDHTLYKLFLEGWLAQIDRTRFEVTAFHTGRVADAVTARCAASCERFVTRLPSAAAWRDAISATLPHVLLYPEVGIDPTAGRLAAMRLAPVQCVTWGHPVTTGMPTIDYYLSSALMEPENGERWYTERLVNLPNLGMFYTPDEAADSTPSSIMDMQPSSATNATSHTQAAATPLVMDTDSPSANDTHSLSVMATQLPIVMAGRASTRVRVGPATHDFATQTPAIPHSLTRIEQETIASRRRHLGLDPNAPIFWSGQAISKYLPQYDTVFPRIAAAVGACQFVFIAFAKSQAVTDTFHARLAAAFAAAGLDAANHIVILPPMSQTDYLAAVGLADVILDTPGWSGGKSTLDCLAQDPAIVTLPGRFMRGRHTTAILRRIGCEATIARSIDDYIEIAVRLAKDPVWRNEIRRAVAGRKHRAFNDFEYMRGLETFLSNAVSRADQSRQTAEIYPQPVTV